MPSTRRRPSLVTIRQASTTVSQSVSQSVSQCEVRHEEKGESRSLPLAAARTRSEHVQSHRNKQARATIARTMIPSCSLLCCSLSTKNFPSVSTALSTQKKTTGKKLSESPPCFRSFPATHSPNAPATRTFAVLVSCVLCVVYVCSV